ncbi:hypothetical protein HRbin24_01348 [bacterium HR24]|nr:hypothetical protein HRbin24_01348 [bacterium HR24]
MLRERNPVLEELIDGYLAKPYSVLLTPQEEGGFVAEVVELTGCWDEGETAEEAVGNLRETMRAWLESALSQGLKVPEPLEARHYSGKLMVRMPASLHRRVALLAQLDGVSINQWIVGAIAEKAGAQTAKLAAFETTTWQLPRGAARVFSPVAGAGNDIGWAVGRSVTAQDPAES